MEQRMQDDDLAAVMRALGHPVRLSILRILAEKSDDCCCMDVTECLPLAQSTVSQHIKVLLDAGLVERNARGTRNCYSLRTDRIDALASASNGLFASLAVDLERRKEPA
jgi:ArsR family transcriptional regulator, arsenate/arsenite/antimonite-responsive transcriptional repressor